MLRSLIPRTIPSVALKPIASTSSRRLFTNSALRYAKDPKMNTSPPKHEMVYFPEMTSALPSKSGEFRRVLWTGLYSQVVLMTVPVGGDIGDEVRFQLLPRQPELRQGLTHSGPHRRPSSDIHIRNGESYNSRKRPRRQSRRPYGRAGGYSAPIREYWSHTSRTQPPQRPLCPIMKANNIRFSTQSIPQPSTLPKPSTKRKRKETRRKRRE